MRTNLSPSLRFAVLRRDSFACQYCGAPAPTVRLHVDHVEPVVDGGKNTLDNLVTACEECNLGKGTGDAERSYWQLNVLGCMILEALGFVTSDEDSPEITLHPVIERLGIRMGSIHYATPKRAEVTERLRKVLLQFHDEVGR